jgi:hypothetical protein
MNTASAKKSPVTLLNRKGKLSLIHVAKKETGITDEAYRILLEGAAGIGSAAEIAYQDQFNAVMKAFENLGFRSRKKQGKTASRPEWPDAWGGTPGQRAKIEVMWKTCARNPTDRALRAFIKRIARVDHPRFLNVPLARKVIIALGDMMRKAGFDPDTGGRILN